MRDAAAEAREIAQIIRKQIVASGGSVWVSQEDEWSHEITALLTRRESEVVEACARVMCVYCDMPTIYKPAERKDPDGWWHEPLKKKHLVRRCESSKIRTRAALRPEAVDVVERARAEERDPIVRLRCLAWVLHDIPCSGFSHGPQSWQARYYCSEHRNMAGTRAAGGSDD